jgi:DNA-binding response OmpR family regulator
MESNGVHRFVFVIEDDKATRDSLCELLARNGYRALPFSDGGEALKALCGAKPSLVLLDLELRQVSGQDFMRRARSAGLLREVPVLVLTGTLPAELEGAAGVLPKPVQAGDLVGRIHQLLREHGKAAQATR